MNCLIIYSIMSLSLSREKKFGKKFPLPQLDIRTDCSAYSLHNMGCSNSINISVYHNPTFRPTGQRSMYAIMYFFDVRCGIWLVINIPLVKCVRVAPNDSDRRSVLEVYAKMQYITANLHLPVLVARTVHFQ